MDKVDENYGKRCEEKFTKINEMKSKRNIHAPSEIKIYQYLVGK